MFNTSSFQGPEYVLHPITRMDTKIKATPGAFFFSCRTVCVDQSQAQARAANRRRPSPAAAEQDTLETKLLVKR